MTDGYVKFAIHLTEATLAAVPGFEELNRLRTHLHDLGLIGVYPNGIGYGNVSIRLDDSSRFLITGTATGDRRQLDLLHYCRVDTFDIERNVVDCTGRLPASSEALSHGAVYQSRIDVRCVLHIHDRSLFQWLLNNPCPATAPDAEYGTPAMAREITRLVRAQGRSEGMLVMTGHDEGVITYGRTPALAYAQLESALRRTRIS